MSLSFLTPAAALVGLAVVPAVAALVAAQRRSRRACAVLGLVPRAPLAVVPDIAALTLVGAFTAAAAAQPVATRSTPVESRADAEAIIVLDVSRSMLARTPGKATRLARAQDAAKTLRTELPEVPLGVGSLTDRVLQHLFPSPSENAFAATIERALGIMRPPPERGVQGSGTSFAALSAVASQNFFGKNARRRVLFVLTDGESRPFAIAPVRRALARAHVIPLFVRLWNSDERVYGANGTPEPLYRPEPSTPKRLARIAHALGGRVFGESEIADAAGAAREALGEGPTVIRGEELTSRILSPFAMAAGFLCLLFVVWRRNFAR